MGYQNYNIMWHSGSKGLQIIASIRTGVKTTPSSGYKIIDTSTIVGKAYIHYNEPNPTSIGNMETLNSYDDKNLERAYKKMKFINSTQYKYGIYASEPREEFIKELEKQIKSVKVQEMDKKYKQVIINRLESIKEININFEETKESVKYIVDNIDDLYPITRLV